MLIKNFVNGFVSLKDENLSIIIDPWITDGIYENSWFIHPPLKKFDELYEADFVLITHIHADHFDANALKLTNSNAKILIPDIYPNRNVCKRRLPQELQHRIMFIQPKIKFQLNERCEIEFIPPMNTFGHKTDENNSNDNVPAIDTGIVVTMDGKQFVFLADNFPFESNSLSEQVNGCELFAFPYNTFADDYPLCYDDLSIDEKRQKSLNRNEHKFKLMIDVIRRMNPKNLLPYSSDFLLGGPRSNEFLSVHPEQFLRKEFIASTYERTTKIPTHFIMGNDELLIQDGIGKVTKFENDHDLKTRANELYRQKSNIHDSYKKVDMNEFIANFRIASVNARKKANRNESKFILDVSTCSSRS